MGQLIKIFADGSFLETDQGAFDKWCIYLTRPNTRRYAPRDIQYFQQLLEFSQKYSGRRIYQDFVRIYELTNKNVDNNVLDVIAETANNYVEDKIEMDILFTILYVGMVAEENKANTRLGKKIKRLGLHQVLMEGMPPDQAAGFSKNLGWSVINQECIKRGFGI